MKVRNFYPRQVLRRLQGEHKALSAGQEKALKFLLRRSRKLGYAVSVGSIPPSEKRPEVHSQAFWNALMASCTTHIVLTPSV